MSEYGEIPDDIFEVSFAPTIITTACAIALTTA